MDFIPEINIIYSLCQIV